VVGSAEAAGPPRTSAHNLRHMCAKRLLDKGEDITVVAAILGHSNLNTTFKYLRPGERTCGKPSRTELVEPTAPATTPRPIGDRPAAGDADRAAADPGWMVDLPIHQQAL
jgi:hypothetical protein